LHSSPSFPHGEWGEILRGAKPLSYLFPPSLTREGGQGDRLLNDQSIKLLRKAINKAKLGIRGKNEVIVGVNRVGDS